MDVFYVDYGYAEILNMDDIRFINRHFFEYLAPQAIRVGLAGIQPVSAYFVQIIFPCNSLTLHF